MNRLLVLTRGAGEYIELLRANALPHIDIIASAKEDETRTLVRDCNIVLGNPSMVAGILDDAVGLEWVQSTFAGVDVLCGEGLRRDYVLTGVKGIFGPLMSEYVIAYMLALERHLFETRENQWVSTWASTPYRSLQGLTLGLCGLGSIGKHIARTAASFGMRVVAYKRTPETVPYVDQVYTGDSFDDFLGLPDYLVLVLPRTPETTALIDADALSRMKPSSVLINVGRGNVVVESDLVGALETGVISAAILDVFEEEPLKSTHALWTLPNAYITPHNAAFSFPRDIVGIFCDNYRRFVRKELLQYIIDFNRGY